MQEWEYDAEQIGEEFRSQKEETAYLNERAVLGWEAVCCRNLSGVWGSPVWWYFRRRINKEKQQ